MGMYLQKLKIMEDLTPRREAAKAAFNYILGTLASLREKFSTADAIG
jgi:hypothetical protein